MDIISTQILEKPAGTPGRALFSSCKTGCPGMGSTPREGLVPWKVFPLQLSVAGYNYPLQGNVLSTVHPVVGL